MVITGESISSKLLITYSTHIAKNEIKPLIERWPLFPYTFTEVKSNVSAYVHLQNFNSYHVPMLLIYIFRCSSTITIGVERVNQEKRLVEFAGYITLVGYQQ